MLSKQEIDPETPEIELLKEWLSGISRENRAYIKGATKALLYVQEFSGDVHKQGNIEKH